MKKKRVLWIERKPNCVSHCLNRAKEVSTWILNWSWPCAFLRKAGSWGHWSVLWWTVQHCAWLGGMSIVWITAKQKELDSSEHSIISFENNGQSHEQQPLQLSWAEFNSFITRDRQFGYSQPSSMNPAYSVLISCVTWRSSISAAAIGKSHLYFIVCSSYLTRYSSLLQIDPVVERNTKKKKL